MKLKIKILATVVLMAALVLGRVSSALAANVVSVSPSSIPNNVASVITVTGSGFDESAVIVADGNYRLPTNYINDSTLTAHVPAGIAPRDYQ